MILEPNNEPMSGVQTCNSSRGDRLLLPKNSYHGIHGIPTAKYLEHLYSQRLLPCKIEIKKNAR